ncbi:hypothetical protein TrispH2_005764 [Trichoplax sp. H2]|nr:hypothetical protein TrispH2_005764 [Trichoplax sp. H2]|eukprot:RDD42102.1 hypothetical protein TrispH2_005764 [Trichoplax sp. H2]
MESAKQNIDSPKDENETAAEKDVQPILVSIIFSIYPIMVFLLSPFFGILGITVAAYQTATFAVAASLFQESMATALVGDFKLPFIVTGGFMAASAIVLLIFMPSHSGYVTLGCDSFYE